MPFSPLQSLQPWRKAPQDPDHGLLSQLINPHGKQSFRALKTSSTRPWLETSGGRSTISGSLVLTVNKVWNFNIWHQRELLNELISFKKCELAIYCTSCSQKQENRYFISIHFERSFFHRLLPMGYWFPLAFLGVLTEKREEMLWSSA